MSSIESVSQPVGFDPASLARAHPKLVLSLALVAAACLGQLTALDKLIAVFTTGAFFDTDDAMRAVQVRDLMAGQSWFDMSQYRLDPPAGVFMHWSRLVDVPLVVLVKFFSLVAEPAMAERLARLAFPLLLTIAFFAVTIALCERLLGKNARYFALAAVFLYGPATGQFEPGRIDHHAPQIVLLMIVTWGLAEALVERRFRLAAVAGAALALSMAISVENVPFFACVIGALVLVWAFDGTATSPVLRNLAGGLAIASSLVFIATVGPSRWLIVEDDALSLSQLVAMISASGALALLAALPLRKTASRVACASVLGLLVGVALQFVFPGLAEKPFAHLDPMLRTLWLDHVEEAQPLLRKWQEHPAFAIGITMPALIGIVASAWFVVRDADVARRRVWLVITFEALGGLAASFVMIRTMSSVQALAVPGSLAIVLAIRRHLSQRHVTLAGPAATFALILATSSVGWAAATIRLGQTLHSSSPMPAVPTNIRPSVSSCATPAAFAQLATLPKGLVLADPDLGGYILAHTAHSIVTGAYHRNVSGMRAALDIFAGNGRDLDRAIAETNANYIVICSAAADLAQTQAAPNGLLARLLRDDAPATLRHLAAHGATLRIYTAR